MKTLRRIFVLVVLTTALYSCDSDVTMDDPQNETSQSLDQIYAEGEDGNKDTSTNSGPDDERGN